MAKHKSSAELSKHLFRTVEQIKQIVSHNLVLASARAEIPVDRDSIEKVVQFVGASIDQGYNQVARDFERTADRVVDDILVTVSTPKKT